MSKGASQLSARHTPSNGCPTTAAYTAKTPAIARVSSISYPASRRSPESNGMAEAFAQTFKRDYLRVNLLPEPPTVLQWIAGQFEDYNEIHPQSGLGMRSPRELIRAHQAAGIPANGATTIGSTCSP